MYSSLAMSAAERVCTPRIICSGHAWWTGHYMSTSALPLLKAFFHGITHTPYTFIKWQWIFTGPTPITHKNQNTLHTSKSAMVPADHPSLT